MSEFESEIRRLRRKLAKFTEEAEEFGELESKAYKRLKQQLEFEIAVLEEEKAEAEAARKPKPKEKKKKEEAPKRKPRIIPASFKEGFVHKGTAHLCAAMTCKRTLCKHEVKPGHVFCHVHAANDSGRTPGRIKCGKKGPGRLVFDARS